MNRVKLFAFLFGGASSIILASAAQAQTQGGAQTSEVVVTGSRVIANGNNSPTPVTVVQAQELMQLQPTTLFDALNDLPVFQGSRGQFSQPNTTGLFGGGNPATSELNLRNLGAQRTLILFDGQRVPPTNALGIVDVDMIPQELVQRVDVVTGGASAVYGSDAVAGVVNYVIDHNFNGFKADASYGESSFSDDKTWKIGLAAGAKFANDMGHIEISYDHYDTAGLPSRFDRPQYLNCQLQGISGLPGGAGSATNPYGDYCNVHSTQNTFGGLITNGALKGQTFNSNGVLTPFQAGSLTLTNNYQVGGDGTQTGYNSLAAPYHFDQVFVRMDYDLTDQIRGHAEVVENWKVDTTFSNPSSFNNQTFSTSNAFLPAAYQTAMGAATTFNMSKNYLAIPLLKQVSNVQNLFVNAGLDGKFGKYNWAVDVDYGANAIHDVFYNSINQQYLAAALDAVVNPANGQTVCRASLTNSAYSNCVPFNAFGPNAASAAAINYVTGTTHYTPEFNQIDLNGHISGDIFQLPAGPVTAAISAEYRKQGFYVGSDALPSQFANCTGLTYNCSASTLVYVNSFAALNWTYDAVKEAALEAEIPILKNQPLFQALDFNGAVRFTDYDYGGSVWTWKVGLEWHLNDEVTVRATQSLDVQAPSLSMLFGPVLYNGAGQTFDLLTQQNSSGPTINIGNPNVKPETAHNTTVGVIWRPQFVPGLAFTVDAYHVIDDGALVNIQAQATSTQQTCDALGGVPTYCSLIVRPLPWSNTSPPNTATEWLDGFENVGAIETYGADFEVNYAHRLFDRPFSARLLSTWQPHYLYTVPGSPTYDFGNVAFPNLVPMQGVPSIQFTGTVNYAFTDAFTASVTERWRSAMSLLPGGAGFYKVPEVPAYATTNLNFSYKVWKAGDELYLNVQNLFAAMPPQEVSTGSNSGFPLTDSPIGRFITLGFRVRY
ncbi:MAG TPA: TonB-dependent receptor [Caulobacteraceae bacterium]|nr:TonB-dependent receptor [Caulobacteraceae bacterium]